MTPTAWIAAASLALNVALVLYTVRNNRRDREWSRDELPRKRAAEIREELIEFLATLRAELTQTDQDLAEKLESRVEAAKLGMVAAQVGLIQAKWTGLSGLTVMQDLHRTALEVAGDKAPAEARGAVENSIAEIDRARPIQVVEMREAIKHAQESINTSIDSLNRAAAGKPLRHDEIGLA